MLKVLWGAPEGDLLSLAWQVSPPFPHRPLHRSGLYIYIGSALWNSRRILRRPLHSTPLHSTSSTLSILLFWGITEPFLLGDEMTKYGGVVRLITSRSQDVSLSRLESSEVTKGTIVPFDPCAFSATERLPLALSTRICLEISQNLLQSYASWSVRQQLWDTRVWHLSILPLSRDEKDWHYTSPSLVWELYPDDKGHFCW